MIVAIASGKGGTGKTTVAVSLARILAGPVRLLDADVEAPNAHIFLKSPVLLSESVCVPVPVVEAGRCVSCGACGKLCQYHAIVPLKTKTVVFPELCHGCGGCVKVCPSDAITEVPREIGKVKSGSSGTIGFVQGRLNVGEPMSPPVIAAVKRYVLEDGWTIVDCPPGTSCPFIEAVRGSDVVVLVTEPTPFGLHDLELAVETVRALGLPFGVIINRADTGDARVETYCASEGIEILLRIPDDRRIAEAYARGEPVLDVVPGLPQLFGTLPARILALNLAVAKEL